MHFTTRLMDALSQEQMQEVAKENYYYSYQQGVGALREYWQNLRHSHQRTRVKLCFRRPELADHVRHLLSPLFEMEDHEATNILLISDDKQLLEGERFNAALLLTYDQIPSPANIHVVRRVIKPSQLVKAVHETLLGMTSQFISIKLPPIEKHLPVRLQANLEILVAEDNLLNQKLLVKVLEKFGHHPRLAADGKEAVAKCLQLQPDLILMDMEMPNVTGCEATRLIRSHSCKQPHIVALTANAFVEDREQCLRAGMCGYLSKPIDWQALEAVLQETLLISRGDLACPSCQRRED